MRKPLIMKLPDDAHKWGKPEDIDRRSALSIKKLCEIAGIECRVFGHHADFKMIAIFEYGR